MADSKQTLVLDHLSDETYAETRLKPQPYWSAYASGVGLGLVLLAAFVIMGRGLGASGAFTTVIASGVKAAPPEHAGKNKFYTEYIGDGSQSPLRDWIVIEVLGVLIGGSLSGAIAGRTKRMVEKGARISSKARLLYAFAGGMIMGIGAKLARGCTSGQALTGGALLNVGRWAFMIALFAGAYAAAYFVRRQWT